MKRRCQSYENASETSPKGITVSVTVVDKIDAKTLDSIKLDDQGKVVSDQADSTKGEEDTKDKENTKDTENEENTENKPTAVQTTPQPKKRTSTTTQYVVGVQQSLYLRRRPNDAEEHIITTIPKDAPVLFVENTNKGYSLVIYNYVAGYVNEKCLADKVGGEPSIPDQDKITSTKVITNVEVSINFRSYPDSDEKYIMTTIPKGAAVTHVEDTDNGYSLVIYDNLAGYVKSTCLSTSAM